MLSVKEEGILAWTGDDNFVVEDKSTMQPEKIKNLYLTAAFVFFLNLHAIAEQLEKIDLAQILFIEADLYPQSCMERCLRQAALGNVIKCWQRMTLKLPESHPKN